MDISVTIKGRSPLLCNRYPLHEQMVKDGTSAAFSGKKGTPRVQAEPKLYIDSEGKPVLPGPNIAACITEAGKFHKVGKSKLTTMTTSILPSCLTVIDMELPIVHPKPWEVYSCSVVNPSTKGRIPCHRPMFQEWEVTFTLDLDTTIISDDLLREVIDTAGKRVGLGDYRPARKGPFGRFVVTRWEELNQ